MVSGPDTLPASARQCFEHNLAALRTRQPAVADALTAADWPAFSFETGRDGSTSIRINEGPGVGVWFGGSSMPSVSADAIVGFSSSEDGSIVLPGVQTGREILLLLERRAAHTAVYVWEPHPQHMLMAFCLYDYADAMERHRLVWLSGDQPADELADFLAANHGFEMPQHILRVPGFSAQQTDELQRGLELTGAAHARHVAAEVERLRQRWSETSAQPVTGGISRLMVWGADPSPSAVDRAAGIKRALEGLDCDSSIEFPEDPSRAHTLARLSLINDFVPQCLVYLGAMPMALRRLLPDSLTVVHWCAAGGIDRTPPLDLPHRDIWLTPHRRALFDTASWGHRVSSLDMGVDISRFHPPGEIAPGDTRVRRDNLVPIVMSLPPDQPGYYDVGLTSYLNLWQTLHDVLRERSHEFRYEIADQFLKEAERRCGVEISDPDIRTDFIGWLRHALAPAAMGRAVLRALQAANLNVVVHGDHWGHGDCIHPPLATVDAQVDCLRSSRVVILGSSQGLAIEAVMQAAACGTVPFCFGGFDEACFEHPILEPLLAHVRFYRNAGELVSQVRDVMALSPELFAERSRQMAAESLQHSATRRLEQILQWVGHHGGSGS
ncbi:MAG: hypothetical protein ACPGXK_01705 [Phycisphaerae bacterium]